MASRRAASRYAAAALGLCLWSVLKPPHPDQELVENNPNIAIEALLKLMVRLLRVADARHACTPR